MAISYSQSATETNYALAVVHRGPLVNHSKRTAMSGITNPDAGWLNSKWTHHNPPFWTEVSGAGGSSPSGWLAS
jgi:hypothetical protein